MTSEERREGRFRRRTERRIAKKMKSCAYDNSFSKAFSYANLYKSYRKCRRNVAWKASVQKYITQAPLVVYQTHEQLLAGKWRSKGFFEFDLNERGKIRHIKAVNMEERVVQGCLCDNVLLPVFSRSFIYDNSASQRGKGYHFALRRCCRHLREHYRKHKNEGYVLLFDFRKFFDNVSHRLCRSLIHSKIEDPELVRITEYFIDAFGSTGLGLGSPVSQVMALSSADRLDHYIKEVCGIRGYGRYMDDGYLIHESKEYLKKCLCGIRRICTSLEITLNEKKTQIVKLSHGFTFLKARLYLTKTGRVIRKIPLSSVTRERRKLKKLEVLLNHRMVTFEDIKISYQSWRAYAMNFNAWRTIHNMDALYNELFITKWIFPDSGLDMP